MNKLNFEWVRTKDKKTQVVQRYFYLSCQLAMTQMKLPRIIGTCILLLAGKIAMAQSGLALSLLNYTIQTDSVNFTYGYTITINATLTNVSQSAYSDTLDFALHNNQFSVITANSVFKKPPYSAKTITLQPGESVPAVFGVKIDAQYFAPGPDVVVVWPICNQIIADSIVIDLHINDPMASAPEVLQPASYLVLSDKIILQNTGENNFEQVRIFSISGQLMYLQHSSFITEIPLGYLPKGIYIAELITADKRRQVIKFFK